jgi:WXG100 family type VII secretion target
MTTPKVRADHEALKSIAQSFSAQADQTKQMTQNLKSKMGTLEGGDWVGKGATKFYNEMNSSVFPSLNRLSSALDQASAVTKKISQLMRQTEDEAAKIFVLDGGNSNGSDSEAGTRQKGGADGGVGTGAIAGGIVGGVLGIVGGIGGMAAGAAAGAWVGDKIEGMIDSSAQRSEAKAKNDAIRKLMADNPDGAVQEAIKQYNIDTSKFKSVTFDKDCPLDADVKADGTMRVGPSALRSPGYLASTIGHEAVHRDQTTDGRLDPNASGNSQNGHMNEVEAYDWELKNADKHGLDDTDIRTITRRRENHYKQLSDENKKRVDNGDYHSVG